jgi:hypothetical protein
MTEITIHLTDTDYKRLAKAAKYVGKSIQVLICEWIS